MVRKGGQARACWSKKGAKVVFHQARRKAVPLARCRNRGFLLHLLCPLCFRQYSLGLQASAAKRRKAAANNVSAPAEASGEALLSEVAELRRQLASAKEEKEKAFAELTRKLASEKEEQEKTIAKLTHQLAGKKVAQ